MGVSFDNWTRQKQSQTQFVPKIIIWCPHGDFHLPPLSTPERDPPFAQHDSPGGHVWAVRRWHHFIIILTIITWDALVGRICLITHTLQRLGVWGKSREHFDVQDHHVCSFLLSTVPVFEQCDYTDLCAHLLFIYQQFLHTGKERSSHLSHTYSDCICTVNLGLADSLVLTSRWTFTLRVVTSAGVGML